MDPNEIFALCVTNETGARRGFTGTQNQCNKWLKSWGDPENLAAEITDNLGRLRAFKPRGRKTIPWPK